MKCWLAPGTTISATQARRPSAFLSLQPIASDGIVTIAAGCLTLA
jgi:hypothetical protein